MRLYQRVGDFANTAVFLRRYWADYKVRPEFSPTDMVFYRCFTLRQWAFYRRPVELRQRDESIESDPRLSIQSLEDKPMFDRIAKSRLFTGVLVGTAVLMLLAMNLAIAAPTSAQGPSQSNRPDPRKDARERQFEREQTWFDDQTKRLADASVVATKTQDYVKAQNALGKDTSSLVAALATYNSQLATAQSSHNAAGTLISAHSGFDANGTVTNLAQATQTVIDLRHSLMDAHQVLRQAGQDLRKAIRTYRQANLVP